eukprot:CAMPEP_0178427170 /NCGR_PEP_ID=MMETSP0689_2-20121128/29605_1 /TAXON_ID=160604 /ORGANISM="Amphidinium massartii, Strain CS-259" /LENGTH=38 /DNA_ID= /DNA_START= /DNA_END= /DNA_ORIENTATION=
MTNANDEATATTIHTAPQNSVGKPVSLAKRAASDGKVG